ncbi:MAG: hypothetical protein M3029_03040 [Lactobacillus helsingborgensis]|nr:hypothetical protein [Lactobacillus helsingborgensis]
MQGFERDAAMLTAICQTNFDEENCDTCIKRLIEGNDDLLVGFDLAIGGNNKMDSSHQLKLLSFFTKK